MITNQVIALTMLFRVIKNLFILCFLWLVCGVLQSNVNAATLSVYWAVEGQTDSTPLLTSNGSRIKDPMNPPKWCAVPGTWIGTRVEYGQIIFIDCDCPLYGEYMVMDKMNERYSYCEVVDLLQPIGVWGLYDVTIWY